MGYGTPTPKTGFSPCKNGHCFIRKIPRGVDGKPHWIRVALKPPQPTDRCSRCGKNCVELEAV